MSFSNIRNLFIFERYIFIMEYRVEVLEEYTPAKRWSFLLGENEGCHTAKSQLLEILASDNENPTLDELIEAFNIETVTTEFYEK